MIKLTNYQSKTSDSTYMCMHFWAWEYGISGAVNIRDDKDGQNDEIIGDTKYIPLYTYVDQPPKYASSQN